MRHKLLWLIACWLALAALVGCSQGISIDSGEMLSPSPNNSQREKTDLKPPAYTQVADGDIISPTASPLPLTLTPQEALVKENPTPVTYDPALEPLVEQARVDLATRLSIPEDSIILVKAQDVVWPDTSLGCPHPDMRYRQVPQDGSLIIFKVGEREYEYHSGGGRGLFLCENLLKTKRITPDTNIVVPPPARSIDE